MSTRNSGKPSEKGVHVFCFSCCCPFPSAGWQAGWRVQGCVQDSFMGLRFEALPLVACAYECPPFC